jgi:uncharacterized membrane protein
VAALESKTRSNIVMSDWAIFNKTTVDNIKSSNGKQLRSESGRGGEAVALIGLKKKSLLIIV